MPALRVNTNICIEFTDATGMHHSCDWEDVALDLPTDAYDWDNMGTDDRNQLVWDVIWDQLFLSHEGDL